MLVKNKENLNKICYPIIENVKFKRGIIMLKFQNNYIILTGNFEDFILLVYVTVDDLKISPKNIYLLI